MSEITDNAAMALKQAIEAVGSQAALARALGIAQPSIAGWRRVPATRVLAVEAASGVPRHVLRPDVFPAPEEQVAE